MIRIIFIICLFGISLATLQIYEPEELRQKFSSNNNSINHTIANFGHIPYGRKMIGTLVAAKPIDACQQLQISQHTQDAPFILIKRGNCSFVQKVNNAQMIGAKMAIIADNIKERSEYITMGDDGNGDRIGIPSIFISEQDGETLLAEIYKQEKQSEEQQKSKQHISLFIVFNTNKTDIVQFYFWLNVPSQESFVLLRQFNQLRKKIESKTQFEPIYQFFSMGSYSGYSAEQVDCLGGGRYCCIDPDGPGKVGTGQQLAKEYLREICIYQIDKEKWWAYMLAMQDNCAKPQEFDDCGLNLMKQSQINIDVTKVEKCVIDSYNTTSNKLPNLQQNYILDRQIEFNKYSGSYRIWPSVTINNISYRGSINATDIMEAICATMITPTDECKDLLKKEEVEIDDDSSGPSVIWIVIIVLVILFVFFLFMVFIYRRMFRKELTKEINPYVNQMVSQYIAFYESKEKKNNKSTDDA